MAWYWHHTWKCVFPIKQHKKKSRRKRLDFEDDDNGADQDKEIRDIEDSEDSLAQLNISGIEHDNKRHWG